MAVYCCVIISVDTKQIVVKIKNLITLDGTVEAVAVTFVGTFLLICAVAEFVVV